MAKKRARIAIIGAGMAGLTLARALQTVADIKVFDKSRGVGGRMATRHAAPFSFDHGAQFFTARSRAFRDFLEPWKKAGVVAEWEGRVITLAREEEPKERIWFEPHYVACPGMTGLAKAMAKGIEVVLNTEVAPLGSYHGSWSLADVNGAALGEFDWVIVTAPVVQAVRLLEQALPPDNPIAPVMLQACYALMVGFDKPWDQDWIGAKLEGGALEWVSIDSTKPGRNSVQTAILAHSRHAWAQEHLEMDHDSVQKILLDELQYFTGIDCTHPNHVSVHRWRYALVEAPTKTGPYLDAAQRLAAVGDWSVTSRIEEVWYAATDLAEKIARAL